MSEKKMTKPFAVSLALIVSLAPAWAFAPTGKPSTPGLDKRISPSSGVKSPLEIERLIRKRLPLGFRPCPKSGLHPNVHAGGLDYSVLNIKDVVED